MTNLLFWAYINACVVVIIREASFTFSTCLLIILDIILEEGYRAQQS